MSDLAPAQSRDYAVGQTRGVISIPANDPYDLQRFVDAQAPVYGQVCTELRKGRKSSHWMWFIFPQIRGLGSSSVANKYGIASLDEARAYLAHPLLGPRLEECCDLVNSIENRSLEKIFGYPDDLKFRSAITLFAQADPGNSTFKKAIQKYCEGEFDPLTLARLGRGVSSTRPEDP